MKETWVKNRKQTALKELERISNVLQASQGGTRNPMEYYMITGILSLVEQGIQGVTSGENPTPPWLLGLLGSVTSPLTESGGYRRVARILRQFDIEEILSTPEEVVDDLLQWEGDEDVGLFALRAAYHAQVLAQLVDREYVKDLVEIVGDLTGARRDPLAAPGDRDSARWWRQLPDAIATAANAYELLAWECNNSVTVTEHPDLSRMEQAAEQAALARRYLWEAREALVEKNSDSRSKSSIGDLTDEEWSLVGRDLYHNRIRKENVLVKGQFVVIDIKSGDFEVGENDHEAHQRLRERRPDARTWVEKVGYPTPHVMVQRPTSRS